MGKRDRYIYQVINEDGEIIYEGLAKEVAFEFVVDTNYIYYCYKHRVKMLSEYTINRKFVPDYWKPSDNDIYYYVSSRGVIEDYFSTKDFTRLARYNIGNCFKTRGEALKNYDEIENKLKTFYEST